MMKDFNLWGFSPKQLLAWRALCDLITLLFWFSCYLSHIPFVPFLHVISINIAYQSVLIETYLRLLSEIALWGNISQETSYSTSPGNASTGPRLRHQKQLVLAIQICFIYRMFIHCGDRSGFRIRTELPFYFHLTQRLRIRSHRSGFGNISFAKRYTPKLWEQRKEICWRLSPL